MIVASRFVAAPRAAYAELVASLRRGEAHSVERVFWWLGVAGLLADPPSAARAVWGAGLRNPAALLALLHLALTPVIAGLVFSGACALILRFTVAWRPAGARGEFDLAQLFDLAACANMPRVAVMLLSSLAWACGGPLPILDSLADAPAMVLSELVLGWGSSLVWIWLAARAMKGVPSASSSLAPRVVRVVLFSAIGIVAARTVINRELYRPTGRGDVLASVTVRDLQTGDLRTISFPHERKVVVDFWATWCPPCRAALPAWQKLQNENADFVSLNLEPEAPDKVKNFLRQNSYTFDVSEDARNLQAQLQVDTLPTVVIIGTSGRIEKFWVGGASENMIRAALR